MKKLLSLFLLCLLVASLFSCGTSKAPLTQKAGGNALDDNAMAIAKSSLKAYINFSDSKSGKFSSSNKNLILVYNDSDNETYYVYDCEGTSIVLRDKATVAPNIDGTLVADSTKLDGINSGVSIYKPNKAIAAISPTPDNTATDPAVSPTATPSKGATAKSALADADYAMKVFMNNLLTDGTPLKDGTAFVTIVSDTRYFTFVYEDGTLTARSETKNIPDDIGTQVEDANLLVGVPKNVLIFVP